MARPKKVLTAGEKRSLRASLKREIAVVAKATKRLTREENKVMQAFDRYVDKNGLKFDRLYRRQTKLQGQLAAL